jgi:hypothetical protein
VAESEAQIQRRRDRAAGAGIGQQLQQLGTWFSTPPQPNPSNHPEAAGRMPSHSPRSSAAMTASYTKDGT